MNPPYRTPQSHATPLAFRAASALLLAAGIVLAGLDRPSRAHDTPHDRHEQARLGIIVPAYFYPGEADIYWPALTRAAARVPVTAIVNPASGPGRLHDPNYQRVISNLKQAGGRAVGYVHTRYGQRPLPSVTGEIDRYFALYSGLDGFFVDEMSNQADPHQLAYYERLYAHVKSMGKHLVVIGNPGTRTVASYLSRPTADVLVSFESGRPAHSTYTSDNWVHAEPATRIAHLVYQSSDEAAMHQTISRAMQHNAGMVYVTSDSLVNPWDTLPEYWEAQVRCVQQINHGAGQCRPTR